jgi:hypothetical protein
MLYSMIRHVSCMASFSMEDCIATSWSFLWAVIQIHVHNASTDLRSVDRHKYSTVMMRLISVTPRSDDERYHSRSVVLITAQWAGLWARPGRPEARSPTQKPMWRTPRPNIAYMKPRRGCSGATELAYPSFFISLSHLLPIGHNAFRYQ